MKKLYEVNNQIIDYLEQTIGYEIASIELQSKTNIAICCYSINLKEYSTIAYKDSTVAYCLPEIFFQDDINNIVTYGVCFRTMNKNIMNKYIKELPDFILDLNEYLKNNGFKPFKK